MNQITLKLPTGESLGVYLDEAPSLEQLRHKYSLRAKPAHMELKEFFPCMECQGAGKIYDPSEQPCPVEGNKMRRKIKCPKCQGTGLGKKETYEALLREIRAKVNKSNQKKRAQVKLAQAMLDRAKPAEWNALRSLFQGLY